jgi:hypothetical protein
MHGSGGAALASVVVWQSRGSDDCSDRGTIEATAWWWRRLGKWPAAWVESEHGLGFFTDERNSGFWALLRVCSCNGGFGKP